MKNLVPLFLSILIHMKYFHEQDFLKTNSFPTSSYVESEVMVIMQPRHCFGNHGRASHLF
jgi:hypothetical protein